jgi:5-methylcytosine-specific restriction endonuclease McrA
MINPRDVISYLEMCSQEGTSLQRGMNFHLRGDESIILMSLRPNAPYTDGVEDNGRILIYEGHDVSKTQDTPIPKIIDQPMNNPGGTFTQNGLFYQAAQKYKNNSQRAELVRVYEKLHTGIWVYNGTFKLVDAWEQQEDNRKVFKFKLELSEETSSRNESKSHQKELEHNRMIPPKVKLEVWKRDKGRCVICGSTKNLHFDHDLPFSKGGTSLTAKNIQILCAKHNLSKGNKIQ